MVENIQIDPEFQELLHPLTVDERTGLEASIAREGCRDALVVWDGTEPPTLLDGHNRKAICEAKEVPYSLLHKSLEELPDREAAWKWIIANQLGKRNITAEQASYLRGKRYNREKQTVTNPTGKNQHGEVEYHYDLQPTADRLADEFKVSAPTIKRDGTFADAVDTVEELAGQKAKEAILSRDAALTKKETVKLAKIARDDPKEAKAIGKLILSGKTEDAAAKIRRWKKPTKDRSPPLQPPLLTDPERCQIACADCLAWFAEQPTDSIDLVFGSPPYEDARLYLENGEDSGIARNTEEWVAWMVKVYKAALRCCKGLVAFVVDGRTKDYRWTAAPALLMADLHRAGIFLRRPPIYYRHGIPGSGGRDWLRNVYEFIVCATHPGELPWSDNTALGDEPKYDPGGQPSHRTQNGERVNRRDGHASMEDRNNLGPHRARQSAGRTYTPPEKANPGNVIRCIVGGGTMGDSLVHENEAPFPESLAEFFVRSFCPLGGIVCDPFSGSGTTAKMALQWHRRFRGCDVRQSQVDLSNRRIAQGIQQQLPLET